MLFIYADDYWLHIFFIMLQRNSSTVSYFFQDSREITNTNYFEKPFRCHLEQEMASRMAPEKLRSHTNFALVLILLIWKKSYESMANMFRTESLNMWADHGQDLESCLLLQLQSLLVSQLKRNGSCLFTAVLTRRHWRLIGRAHGKHV